MLEFGSKGFGSADETETEKEPNKKERWSGGSGGPGSAGPGGVRWSGGVRWLGEVRGLKVICVQLNNHLIIQNNPVQKDLQHGDAVLDPLRRSGGPRPHLGYPPPLTGQRFSFRYSNLLR